MPEITDNINTNNNNNPVVQLFNSLKQMQNSASRIASLGMGMAPRTNSSRFSQNFGDNSSVQISPQTADDISVTGINPSMNSENVVNQNITNENNTRNETANTFNRTNNFNNMVRNIANNNVVNNLTKSFNSLVRNIQETNRVQNTSSSNIRNIQSGITQINRTNNPAFNYINTRNNFSNIRAAANPSETQSDVDNVNPAVTNLPVSLTPPRTSVKNEFNSTNNFIPQMNITPGAGTNSTHFLAELRRYLQDSITGQSYIDDNGLFY